MRVGSQGSFLSAVLVLATGCTIHLKKSNAEEQFSCPKWENKSAAEVEQLVAESLPQADGGTTATVWQDEVAFTALITRIYQKAGCPLPTDLNDLSSNGNASNYCGPGHGRYLPTVDECVNQGCRAHDACYAMCDDPLDQQCYFSSATSSCDDQFVTEIEKCDISEHRFASLITISLAKTLNAEDKASCSEIKCPTFGELGTGTCSVSLEDPSCAQCFEKVDPDGCRSGCDTDNQPAICIAASCSETAQCFGGYGYGVVDAGANDSGLKDGGDANTD